MNIECYNKPSNGIECVIVINGGEKEEKKLVTS